MKIKWKMKNEMQIANVGERVSLFVICSLFKIHMKSERLKMKSDCQK